jgi:Spy/CpxP family protein refolding chaperone
VPSFRARGRRLSRLDPVQKNARSGRGFSTTGGTAMRTLSAALALALAVAFGGAPRPTNAKEEPKGTVVIVLERFQDLNLTEAQEAKIAEIRKEHRTKVQEAHKELTNLLKEEMDKIHGVLTDQQKEKLKTWKDDRTECREECLAHVCANLKELDITDAEMTKIGEIRKEFRPKIMKALEGLHGLLTDQQKKAREDALKAGKSRKEVLEAIGLTAAQKEKAEAVGKDVAALVREEMEKVREVLTEEQKEKLQELNAERKERVRDRMAHATANFKDLNLTDDQKTKITDIRKEYRPKIHEAGNKLRTAVREEMEAIVNVIKG